MDRFHLVLFGMGLEETAVADTDAVDHREAVSGASV